MARDKVALRKVAYCKLENLQALLLCLSEGGLCGAGVRDAAAGMCYTLQESGVLEQS